MENNFKILTALIFAVFATMSRGAEKPPSIPIDFSGYASFQAGEVMKGAGLVDKGEYSHKWLQTGYAGLLTDAAINDHFHVLVGLEGELAFSFYVTVGSVDQARQTMLPQTRLTVKHAEGIYSFGDPENPFLQLEAGLFPYKYNPDVRNLGEYLFRSFAYPQYIISVFDRPYMDMAGLRIGNRIGTSFKQDVLFTSEIHDFPLMDYSLSYVADYNLFKVLDAGAGISFDRLFSVDQALTTNSGDPSTQYHTPSGDSGYYSFSGIKAMARLSFDPKPFLPEGIFGSEDLKVYSELGILGWENYPVDSNTPSNEQYYTNLSERMPIAVGFNFPTCAPLLKRLIGFKLLDLLNGELEFYKNRFPNGYQTAYENLLPLPPPEVPARKHDDLRWSLYMTRNWGKNFSVIVQLAHDHLIPTTFSLLTGSADRTDVLLRHGDWWWVAKTQFTF